MNCLKLFSGVIFRADLALRTGDEGRVAAGSGPTLSWGGGPFSHPGESTPGKWCSRAVLSSWLELSPVTVRPRLDLFPGQGGGADPAPE